MKNTKPEFKIEKGVPMPSIRGRLKYCFEELKPTESVFLPGVRIGSVGYAIQRARLKLGDGAAFISRTENGGIRVWRIS